VCRVALYYALTRCGPHGQLQLLRHDLLRQQPPRAARQLLSLLRVRHVPRCHLHQFRPSEDVLTGADGIDRLVKARQMELSAPWQGQAPVPRFSRDAPCRRLPQGGAAQAHLHGKHQDLPSTGCSR